MSKPLKSLSRLQQKTIFVYILIFQGNKAWFFMFIVCQQTMHMKDQVLFGFLKQVQNFKMSSAAKNFG